jgi:hypothetical protein
MPTIFISHSCKDNEQAPPAILSPPDAAARAGRLAFSRKLRDALDTELKKNPRYTVFLDVRGGLKPGDIWQDGLHRALRTCSAGVVLLTPESLESGWVLKETTILSWRVFLREPVVLVPIVLGVSDDELARRGFGALSLDRIQWVRVGATDQASIDRAVKETVAVFDDKVPDDPLALDQVLPPTERWIQELAEYLRSATASGSTALTTDSFVRMCRALDISPEERKRFDDDPHVKLASQALLASDSQIVRLLNEAGTPLKPLREALKEVVAPLWVDPAPASRLAESASHVVAIDATETKSAREYILRAFCNRIDPDRIVEPTDVTDGSDAQVLDAIVDAVGELFPIDDAAALRSDVEKDGPIFVILGPGSVRPTILDALTRDYPQLTFVTVAGAKPEVRLGAWWTRVRLLYPLLQPNREQAASRYRNRLLKFVG